MLRVAPGVGHLWFRDSSLRFGHAGSPLPEALPPSFLVHRAAVAARLPARSGNTLTHGTHQVNGGATPGTRRARGSTLHEGGCGSSADWLPGMSPLPVHRDL